MSRRLTSFRVVTKDRAFDDMPVIRAANAHQIAKSVGGKIANSCPGWARIARPGKPEITLHW